MEGLEIIVLERLDRVLVNQELLNWLSILEVEHLSRTGSDHASMFLTCEEQLVIVKKSFKFLKFWTEHESFMDVVKQNWIAPSSKNPFLEFKEKLKNVKAIFIKRSTKV